MKKLYLLSLSLLFVTTGYADELPQTDSENVVSSDTQKQLHPHPKGRNKANRAGEGGSESIPEAKGKKPAPKPNRSKTPNETQVTE